ncbi:MAG: hypothetical protein EA412_02485 [Chitinophagaceae bacterium]|nr:MAG: hypothetical protein EA412_02485 [Chitinophagaceae bacterium]
MSIPKEPRQQMITMMYLVLTALLALNVSAEVLNAFKLVHEGIRNTNTALDTKNDAIMDAFAQQMASDPERAREYFERAQQAQQITREFYDYIEAVKEEVIEASGGVNDAGEIRNIGHVDAPTRVMVNQRRGFEVKDRIEEIIQDYLALVFSDEDRQILQTQIPLNTEFNPDETDQPDWVTYNFRKVPVIAAVTILTKFQSDAKQTESLLLENLISQIGASTFRFDRLSAKIIAPSSYVLAGSQYSADIFVSATSETQDPTVYIGELDMDIVERDTFGNFLETTQNPIKGSYDTLPVVAGMGKLNVPAQRVGVQQYSGAVRVQQPGGTGYLYFPFEGQYQVAEGGVVVSPTKMNVMYIGVENPLAISVVGFPSDRVRASISQGTLAGSDGDFRARVNTPGTATVNVSAEMDDGSTQTMGSQEFRVRRIPTPQAKIAGEAGGNMPAARFRAQRGIIAELESFEFDVRFEIVGFEMIYAAARQDVITERANGPQFNQRMLGFMERARPGDMFYFDNIRARGPDGNTVRLPGITFRLI